MRLADEVGLADRLQAQLRGDHINVTEDRAVLHTALRRPAGEQPALVVDGQDIDTDVQAELAKVYAFADKVRSGEWTGVTGERVATVVNIGIGGSDLGPVMAYEALKPYVQDGLEVRFVSNIDPTDLAEKVKGLDPTTTLFIVASKTFGTLETLTNARLARDVALGAAGHRRRRRVAQRRRRQALRRRLDRAGQGRRVRHRPGQRVRVLGLGGRPLLGRLRDRHVARDRRSARTASATSSPASTRSTSTSRRRRSRGTCPS